MLFDLVERDNQGAIYCEVDGEYRVNSDICEKICIQWCRENH